MAAAILVLAVLAAASWGVYRWRTTRVPTAPGWRATVVTIAGDGAPGTADGGAITARFSDPFGIAIDDEGAVYVADAGDSNRIRRLTRDGFVTTFAGGQEGFADGTGRAARFHTPSALAMDRAGALYVADTGNHAIRKVMPDGRVVTLAGTGVAGYRDGPGAQAQFDAPIGIAVDRHGTVFVADTYNDRIRRIAPDGTVTTVAGSTTGFADGPPAEARFDTPSGIAVAPTGDLFVADTGNDAVRRIAADGTVSTLGMRTMMPQGAASASGASSAAASPDSASQRPASQNAASQNAASQNAASQNGAPASTPVGSAAGPFAAVVSGPVARPLGIAVTHDGFVYVSGRGQIAQIAPDGVWRTIAGIGPGWADGDAALARFNMPAGLAIDAHGGLYVAESGSYVVRRLRPPSIDAPPPAFDGVSMPRPRLDAASLGIDVLPWPVDPQDGPHELVGTVGEPRGNRGGDGRDRFHTGIDVSGVDGTIVRAVYREKVRSPIAASWFDSPIENLSAGIFTYMHLRVGRDRSGLPLDPARFPIVSATPDATGVAPPPRVRVRRGTRIQRGDPVGTINGTYHVQIDLGPNGAELNPLSLGITGLVDRVAPTIEADGVRLFTAAGERLQEKQRGRLLLREPVTIVVQAYDQVDGNLKRRKLGVYRLGYQILRADGVPADGFALPRATIEFDRLPADVATSRLAFAAGSGITVYGSPVTQMSYIVTNTVRAGRAEPGLWDPTTLPPGDYIVRALAADRAGNVAVARRDLPVTIVR